MVPQFKEFLRFCQAVLDETKEALENVFSPKRNVVSQRYKFQFRGQRAHETIDTDHTALRELSKTRDFGTFEEMIQDQIWEKCALKSLS